MYRTITVILLCALFGACISSDKFVAYPSRTIICGGPPNIISPEIFESYGWDYKLNAFKNAANDALRELNVSNPVQIHLTSNMGLGCEPAWVSFPVRMESGEHIYFPEYGESYELKIYVSEEALSYSPNILSNIGRHEACHIARNHLRLPYQKGKGHEWTELDAEACVYELIGEEAYLKYRSWVHFGFTKLSEKKIEKRAKKDLREITPYISER